MTDDVELFGRRVILTDAQEITDKNVIQELKKAMTVHSQNSVEEDYLYRYYKGEQPILNRVKDVRPEICNKIVVNVANEIVTFKTDYQCGKPIQYVGMSKDETVTEDVSVLNKYMTLEGKESKDQELFEWIFICGVGCRLVLPRKNQGYDDAPFELHTIDPRTSFVVYSSDIGKRKMMGVKYRVLKDDNLEQSYEYSVYTENFLYTIRADSIGNYKVTKKVPTYYNTVPVFEYQANNARLGSFELVLSLMNAINTVESNRVDGIEQNIQAFLKFINCSVEENDLEQLRELGAIMIKSTDGQKADVESVKTDIDQMQTQVTKDDLYQTILTVCGMPNRNGGSSTSDTGAAVEMRDGWSAAETRAKGVENTFKRSEREMLRFVLKLMRELDVEGLSRGNRFDLKLMDTDIKFTRQNYENIQSKAQVLTTMLDNPKIHPLLGFTHCGMFSDPESAYKMSEEYYKDKMEQEAKALDRVTINSGDGEEDV